MTNQVGCLKMEDDVLPASCWIWIHRGKWRAVYHPAFGLWKDFVVSGHPILTATSLMRLVQNAYFESCCQSLFQT